MLYRGMAVNLRLESHLYIMSCRTLHKSKATGLPWIEYALLMVINSGRQPDFYFEFLHSPILEILSAHNRAARLTGLGKKTIQGFRNALAEGKWPQVADCQRGQWQRQTELSNRKLISKVYNLITIETNLAIAVLKCGLYSVKK